MFAWMSMLVETYTFDNVYVNFLVVGHTHASIDQFFSTLRNRINRTMFVGSPLALLALFLSNQSEKYSVKVAKQIFVCHDLRDTIQHFCLNTTIKVLLFIIDAFTIIFIYFVSLPYY